MLQATAAHPGGAGAERAAPDESLPVQRDPPGHGDHPTPPARRLPSRRDHAAARQLVGLAGAARGRAVLLASGSAAVALAGAWTGRAGAVVLWVVVALLSTAHRRVAGLWRLAPPVATLVGWVGGVVVLATTGELGVAMVAGTLAAVAGWAWVTHRSVRGQAETTLELPARDARTGPVAQGGPGGPSAALLLEHLVGLDRHSWQQLAEVAEVAAPGHDRCAVHLAMARTMPADVTRGDWLARCRGVVQADDAAVEVLFEAAAAHLNDRQALQAAHVGGWMVRAGLCQQNAPAARLPLPRRTLRAAWRVVGEVDLRAGVAGVASCHQPQGAVQVKWRVGQDTPSGP